jgi:hypothetical protein
MRLKITMGIAALALGATFASVPAFAGQDIPGYSADGQVIAIHRHHARTTRSLFDVAPQQKSSVAAPGRNQNDGGQTQ